MFHHEKGVILLATNIYLHFHISTGVQVQNLYCWRHVRTNRQKSWHFVNSDQQALTLVIQTWNVKVNVNICRSKQICLRRPTKLWYFTWPDYRVQADNLLTLQFHQIHKCNFFCFSFSLFFLFYVFFHRTHLSPQQSRNINLLVNIWPHKSKVDFIRWNWFSTLPIVIFIFYKVKGTRQPYLRVPQLYFPNTHNTDKAALLNVQIPQKSLGLDLHTRAYRRRYKTSAGPASSYSSYIWTWNILDIIHKQIL